MPIKISFFVGHILALGAINIISANIFFPLIKVIETVGSRTSFILSRRSWEIGSPPTGGAKRLKLAYVVPASVIHI